ncbi:MAG: beta-lactamase family protein [Microscillaceae bacterium]|nr:beta-lactamase family protein [Microscillaceae bacterium]MDW8460870.1 serine hydrolase domain-containing protein [Cytophagales bacterium]
MCYCEHSTSTETQKAERKLQIIQKQLTEIKAQKISLIFTHLYKLNKFNGNVLVTLRGKEIYKAALGYAHFEQLQPLNFQTTFKIASISKQFTAMAVMILYEQKKLSFDDAVSLHLPEFPYKEITIRHLLTHTSGLPEYLHFLAKDSLWSYAKNSDIINWLVHEVPPLQFQAGTQFQYNNTGYVVLAELVSRLAEMPFSLFMKQYIFEPLEMKNTYVLEYLQHLPTVNRAWGYDPTMRNIIEDSPFRYTQGDSGIYSSIEDLQKWDKALYTQQLVSFQTLFQAYKPYTFPDGTHSPYGFGYYLKDNLQTVYHYGNGAGFRSAIIRNLKEKNCIIILDNTSNPRIEQLAEMVENILHDRPITVPQ